MADLEDAYSDLSGRGYSLPSGTSGLSSYGQRLYGQAPVYTPSIDTDLQTERALLALEQQKSGTIRQLRDTALASLNLREKNRVEEQAGYIASQLGNVDPHSDEFENQITDLYSKFPYGFRDPSINSAISYKRDIRKQFDAVNENVRRDQELLKRQETQAEALQKRQDTAAETREYDVFRKAISPFYYEDFRVQEETAKQKAQQENREFGLDDKRRLMESFAATQAKEKVMQDLRNVDVDPAKFTSPQGAFDYAGARKELFDASKRKEQFAEASKLITTLGPSIQKRQAIGEEVPQAELDLYQNSINTLVNLQKSRTAPAAESGAPTTPATPEIKTLSEKDLDFLDRARLFQVGDMVSINGGPAKKWEAGDVERAKAAFEPKVEEKPVKIEGVAPVKATGKVIPATQNSKFVITLDNPYVKEAYPTGIDIQRTVTAYNTDLRKAAETAFNKQVADTQRTGESTKVKTLIDNKQKIINEFEQSQPRIKTIQMAVADPLIRKMFTLSQKLTQVTDPQELANISKQINELQEAKTRLDSQVYAEISAGYEPATIQMMY
jgi:hypothetical protein